MRPRPAGRPRRAAWSTDESPHARDRVRGDGEGRVARNEVAASGEDGPALVVSSLVARATGCAVMRLGSRGGERGRLARRPRRELRLEGDRRGAQRVAAAVCDEPRERLVAERSLRPSATASAAALRRRHRTPSSRPPPSSTRRSRSRAEPGTHASRAAIAGGAGRRGGDLRSAQPGRSGQARMSSRRETSPSFAKTLARWCSTVLGEM